MRDFSSGMSIQCQLGCILDMITEKIEYLQYLSSCSLYVNEKGWIGKRCGRFKEGQRSREERERWREREGERERERLVIFLDQLEHFWENTE